MQKTTAKPGLTLDSLMRSANAKIPGLVLEEPALKSICGLETGPAYHNLFINKALGFKKNPLGADSEKHLSGMCAYSGKVRDCSVLIDGIGHLLEGVNSLEGAEKEKAAGITAGCLIRLVESVDPKLQNGISERIRELLPQLSQTTRLKLIEILLNADCEFESEEKKDLAAFGLVLFREKDLKRIEGEAKSQYIRLLASFELSQIEDERRVRAIEQGIDGMYTLGDLQGMKFESLQELLMMLKYVQQERIEKEEQARKEFIDKTRIAKPMSEEEARESEKKSGVVFASNWDAYEIPVLLTNIKTIPLEEEDLIFVPEARKEPDMLEMRIEQADPPSGVHMLKAAMHSGREIILDEHDIELVGEVKLDIFDNDDPTPVYDGMEPAGRSQERYGKRMTHSTIFTLFTRPGQDVIEVMDSDIEEIETLNPGQDDSEETTAVFRVKKKIPVTTNGDSPLAHVDFDLIKPFAKEGQGIQALYMNMEKVPTRLEQLFPDDVWRYVIEEGGQHTAGPEPLGRVELNGKWLLVFDEKVPGSKALKSIALRCEIDKDGQVLEVKKENAGSLNTDHSIMEMFSGIRIERGS